MLLARITEKKYPISSPYSLDRVINGVMRPHRAIDIATPTGTVLKSPVFGKVTRTGYDQRAGNFIEIKDLFNRLHLFAHLDSIQVAENESVYPSKKIGETGATGNTTGAHLHYSIENKAGEKIDPAKIYELSYLNRPIGIASILIITGIVIVNTKK